jgi:hypothetical protein
MDDDGWRDGRTGGGREAASRGWLSVPQAPIVITTTCQLVHTFRPLDRTRETRREERVCVWKRKWGISGQGWAWGCISKHNRRFFLCGHKLTRNDFQCAINELLIRATRRYYADDRPDGVGAGARGAHVAAQVVGGQVDHGRVPVAVLA